MELILKAGVIAAAVVCLISLSLMVIRMASFGKRRSYIRPTGDAKQGILYAFGRGMLPGAKESARDHLITYVSGLLYHMSTFAGLLYLVLLIFASGTISKLSIPFLIAVVPGLLAGIGLLFKRVFAAKLRVISSPDDFASNALVDLFLFLVILDVLHIPIRSILLGISILLFLYIPLGKIRHCFFFFYMRMLFGRFYGNRGVLPHRRTWKKNP
jgi:hypothetical protein